MPTHVKIGAEVHALNRNTTLKQTSHTHQYHPSNNKQNRQKLIHHTNQQQTQELKQLANTTQTNISQYKRQTHNNIQETKHIVALYKYLL